MLLNTPTSSIPPRLKSITCYFHVVVFCICAFYCCLSILGRRISPLCLFRKFLIFPLIRICPQLVRRWGQKVSPFPFISRLRCNIDNTGGIQLYRDNLWVEGEVELFRICTKRNHFTCKRDVLHQDISIFSYSCNTELPSPSFSCWVK